MKFTLHVASLLCTLAMLIIGIYTIIALTIIFFIITGTLAPGSEMFLDSETPTMGNTLLFALMGVILFTGLAFARRILSAKIRA